jgi:cytochrome c biogenesis protein CcdA
MENKGSTVNKFKLLFSLGTSILFIMLGFWLYFTKSTQQNSLQPWIIKLIGILNIVLFGILGMTAIKKLLDRK